EDVGGDVRCSPLFVSQPESDARADARLVAERLVIEPEADGGFGGLPDSHAGIDTEACAAVPHSANAPPTWPANGPRAPRVGCRGVAPAGGTAGNRTALGAASRQGHYARKGVKPEVGTGVVGMAL